MTMAALLGEMEDTVSSGILKNESVEKMLPVGAGVKQWQGDFFGWWAMGLVQLIC